VVLLSYFSYYLVGSFPKIALGRQHLQKSPIPATLFIYFGIPVPNILKERAFEKELQFYPIKSY